MNIDISTKKLNELFNQDFSFIKHLENPSEEVQLLAISNNPFAIKYIKNPTDTVKFEAIKNNGVYIEFIKEPSLELQLVAVNQFGSAIKYIKNASLKVKIASANKDMYSVLSMTPLKESEYSEALEGNCFLIKLIENPSVEMQLQAVKKNGLSIWFIEKPNLEVQLAALSQNIKAIYFLEKFTNIESKMYAIKQGVPVSFFKNTLKELVLE